MVKKGDEPGEPMRPPLNNDRIVILRAGLGRDSTAMLALLVEGRLRLSVSDPEGDPRRIGPLATLEPDEVDAVVFTDPGAEWSHTYDALRGVEKLSESAGIRFIAQKKPPMDGPKGWGRWLRQEVIDRKKLRSESGNPAARLPRGRIPPWRRDPPSSIEERAEIGYYHRRAPILDDYASRSTIISRSKGDCTENHKVLPNRELLEDLAKERFGQNATNDAWEKDVDRGVRRPHVVLLGIAADEPDRIGAPSGKYRYEEDRYPLWEMGITKAMEAPILDRHGFGGLHKSGCMMCKFQGVAWYWALSVIEPEFFEKVVEWDDDVVDTRGPQQGQFRRKLKDGTWGHIPLVTAVARWRERNPDATLESVLAKEYRRCDSPVSGLRPGRAREWGVGSGELELGSGPTQRGADSSVSAFGPDESALDLVDRLLKK